MLVLICWLAVLQAISRGKSNAGGEKDFNKLDSTSPSPARRGSHAASA